jgi:sRNA-binding carbon storage regulator CsrA
MGQLTLTRKTGQSVTIEDIRTGEPVAVFTITNVQGARVSIAFDGPSTTRFRRSETPRREVKQDSAARRHVTGAHGRAIIGDQTGDQDGGR